MAKDEADLAAEEEEHLREEAVYNATHPKQQAVHGWCCNCGEVCQGAYCDVECRRDHERRQKAERIQHGS